MTTSLNRSISSKYVDLIVVFITDNIHIVEIAFVLVSLGTFNYVISRSEELQEYNHGWSGDSVSYRGRMYVCDPKATNSFSEGIVSYAESNWSWSGCISAVAPGAKPEKFPRPTVGLDEPIEKWEDFSSSWQQ